MEEAIHNREEDREQGLTYFPYRVSALVLLVLFSVLTIASAIGTYRISLEGSENLLQTRALDIALNLRFTLERFGLRKRLFAELLEASRWEDLAYLALFDENGIVVIHSNPMLTGEPRLDPAIHAAIARRHFLTHEETLATGETVFVLDFPLQLHVENSISPFFCLRISLHTYPAQQIVRRANFQLGLISFSLVLLWAVTLFFIRIWRRADRLESELRKRERMAALGEMAAVLAHEIRNPLSSIKGFAQYHQESCDDPEAREDFSIIVNEAKRLERLTTNLLVYARPAGSVAETLRVEDLCRNLERELVLPVGRDILSFDCSGGLIEVDREKLRQIALNLVQNALDAVDEMPGGYVQCRMAVVQDELVFEVRDNGPGISGDIRERVFEPFVTTKTRGTGLGLAIVNRLVRDLGGAIQLESGPGEGTRVVVRIPSAPHGPEEDDDDG